MSKKVKQLGTCTNGNCTKPTNSSFLHCSDCREAMSQRRYRKVAAGTCRYCPRAARPGTSSCDVCAEKRSRRIREARRLLKTEVIQHYGGKCTCCAETEETFLTMDHIHGGGHVHRKTIANGGEVNSEGFYRWLKANGFPEDFQVLCWNCNCAKGIFGVCPHESSRIAGGRSGSGTV